MAIPQISSDTLTLKEFQKVDLSKVDPSTIRVGGKTSRELIEEAYKKGDLERPTVKGVVGDVISQIGKEPSKLDDSRIIPSYLQPSKLDIPDTQGTYVPELDSFISESPTGFGATGVIQAPSPSQAESIRQANIRGGLFDRPSREIVESFKRSRIERKQFQDLTKDLEDLGKKEINQIEKLSEKNIKNGEWVGSQQDLNKYNQLIEKYQGKIEERLSKIEQLERAGIEQVETDEGVSYSPYFKEEEIPVSLPFFKDKTLFTVPESRFTAKTPSGVEMQTVSEGVGVVGDWIGETTGEISAKTFTGKTKPSYYGEQIGDIIRDPSILKSKFVSLTSGKPDAVYDLDTGEARIPTEKDLDKSVVIPPSKVITEEEARAGGKFVGDTGKYVIPYAGVGFFASDVERETRPYDYNPISFAKAQPVQAGLFGGILLTVGGLATRRYLKTPLFIKEGESLIATTRGRQLFGGRVRFDTYKGDTFLKSGIRTQYLPDEGLFRFQKQPITKGKAPESVKEIDKVLSLSDEPTYKLLGEFGTPIKDTRGFSRQITEGERTIVTQLKPSKVRLDTYKGDTLLKSGVKAEYIPRGQETIFRGLDPYTKAGKLERQNLFKELSKKGISKDMASPLVRLRYPKVVERKADITGLAIEGDKGQRLFLRESETITQPKVRFDDMFGGVTSRGRKQKEIIRDFEIVPDGTTKEGVELFKGGFYEFDVSKQLGKRFQTFNIKGGTKKLGEKELRLTKEKIGDIEVSPTGTFEFYEGVGATQRTIPRRFQVDTGKTEIIIKKPTQREVIDLDDALGIKKDVGFVTTSGKKSSEQYLQSLYAPDTKLISEGLKVVRQTKKTPKTPKPSTIVEQTKRPTESIWAGTGLYERTTGGASISQIVDSQQKTIPPTFLPSILEQQRMDTTQTTFTGVTPRTFTNLSPRVDTKTDLKIDTTQKPLLRLETQTRQLPKSLVGLKERQATKLGLRTKQKTKQVSKQITKTITPLKPIRPTKPKTPKTPKIKFSLLPSSTDTKTTLGFDEDEFKVFVKKAGEDIELGGFGTLGEARTKLQSELIGTLRASGFITKGKTKLGFKDVGITGSQFRPSKKDSFRIVQRKTKRIKTGGEIREILQVRKSGGFSL